MRKEGVAESDQGDRFLNLLPPCVLSRGLVLSTGVRRERTNAMPLAHGPLEKRERKEQLAYSTDLLIRFSHDIVS